MISFSNEKMMKLNIKIAMKTAAALGIELTAESFEQPEVNLVEAFQEGLGREVELELKSWTSKKTGKSGQNFTASPAVPFS